MEFIPNEALCKKAAKALGQKYLFSLNEAGFPKGCIFDGNKLVFWNNHLTGAKSTSRMSICIGKCTTIYATYEEGKCK